ncbi:MAG: Endonuclease [Parcubacteria group bacterium]|nr:Endonuclease [Parcubacteria group bacterium]
MKLICLNTWGARTGEPFFEFIKKHEDTDIFCFQEIYENAAERMAERYPQVRHNLLSELKALMPEYDNYFRPALYGMYGQALFIKKDIRVLEEGEISIHVGNDQLSLSGHHDRNLQWATFDKDGKKFILMNVHGLWNGKGKTDTPERIAQSRRIREFMDKAKGSKIVCGDLNLEPDTESVRIVEEGMRNLIKEYRVTSTRTSLYDKAGRFADYVFTTPDIEIRDFKVLPDEVSDHAALLLEI